MKKRIMTVDDEYDVTYSLKKILEESGLFEVDGFTDPEKALSSFQRSRYDLVILDIRMPYMDGFELYKSIKAIDGRVKVCFLTAVNDLSEYKINYPDIIEEINKGDNHCFIDKPIGSQNLLKRINKTTCLQQRRKYNTSKYFINKKKELNLKCADFIYRN